MKTSTTCPRCRKINFCIWVLVKIDDKMTKLCKPCSDEHLRNPADNLSRFEANKKRTERERSEKNKEIIRQLKTNTYPSTPGSR